MALLRSPASNQVIVDYDGLVGFDGSFEVSKSESSSLESESELSDGDASWSAGG